MEQYRHLDLFSGIGGFALALAEWCETVAFAETDSFCNEHALARNWPQVPNLGDVRKLCRTIADNLDETGDTYDADYVRCPLCNDLDFGDCDCIGHDEFRDRFGFVDIITAGVPCQPASIIGKRKGVADDRWLWPEMLRIVDRLRPTFVICEQPVGILNLDDGNPFRGIVRSLSEIGFCVYWETIPASAVGYGHRRERVWIVAYARGARLERYAGHGKIEGETVPNRPTAPKNLPPLRDCPEWWSRYCPVPIVANGVPDPAFWKRGVIATGNAIVPAVARAVADALFQSVASVASGGSIPNPSQTASIDTPNNSANSSGVCSDAQRPQMNVAPRVEP